MSWFKQIFSATKEEFLKGLGIDQSVISFILSKPDIKEQDKLINEVRKNPQLTIQQLEQIKKPFNPQNNAKNNEIRWVNDFQEPYKSWALIQYRKLRIQNPQSDSWGYRIPYQGENGLNNIIRNIYDWFNSENIGTNIFGYSFELAKQKSDEWHEMMAAKGDGTIYDPTNPKNIVYGPNNWKDPKNNGWTIQLVTSENDLLCER